MHTLMYASDVSFPEAGKLFRLKSLSRPKAYFAAYFRHVRFKVAPAFGRASYAARGKSESLVLRDRP